MKSAPVAADQGIVAFFTEQPVVAFLAVDRVRLAGTDQFEEESLVVKGPSIDRRHGRLPGCRSCRASGRRA
jgi:hypothetical protein